MISNNNYYEHHNEQSLYQLRICYNDDFEDSILLENSATPWSRLMEIALNESYNAELENIKTKMYVNRDDKIIRIEYINLNIITTYFMIQI